MTDINFPDSPSENDKFNVSLKTFKYGSGRWRITKFLPGFIEKLDGGSPSSVFGKVKGGTPKSNFSSQKVIDGGTA